VVTSTFEAIPERAEFRVDAFRDSASIQVFLGEVSCHHQCGLDDFRKGQSRSRSMKEISKLPVWRASGTR